MVNEQNKTIAALKMAIQMEIDGETFYLKASRESGNSAGKELLRSLASEETLHRRKFEKIYEAIRNKKEWHRVEFPPDEGKKLRAILDEATGGKVPTEKANKSELDAVQTAIGMEVKTYDFYKSQGKIAQYQAEKEFYEKLAEEEHQHHLVLLDYYEYLKDPAGWFVAKEHPSLDGG